MAHDLTREYLQHLLHYDPLTGEWLWIRPRSGKLRPGDLAGGFQTKGYRYIKIDGRSYIAARLAFLYMTGEWPKDEVDHINRIQSDDRWENLREANRSQNNYNRRWNGCQDEWRGIAFHHNKYKVTIGRRYLGLFSTFEEAKIVRNQALKDRIDIFIVDSERKA